LIELESLKSLKMRNILIILFSLISVIFIDNTDCKGQIPGTDLNWNTTATLNQSFLSTSLPDPNIWRYNCYGAYSNLHCDANPPCERQYYRTQNLIPSVSGLTLRAIKETFAGRIISYSPSDSIMCDGLPNYRSFDYTSGAITTNLTYSYGYYEAECKVPNGFGFWPAFWMHMNGKEIDVLEIPGQSSNPPVSFQTNVYGTDQSLNNSVSINTINLANSFHKFAVEWTPEQVVFYLDGIQVRSMTGPAGSLVPNEPMHSMFNLAVDPWQTPPVLDTADFVIKNFKHYTLKTAFSTTWSDIPSSSNDFKVYSSYNLANKTVTASNVTLRAVNSINMSVEFIVPLSVEFKAIITKSW
jgi:hypothetical protein